MSWRKQERVFGHRKSNTQLSTKPSATDTLMSIAARYRDTEDEEKTEEKVEETSSSPIAQEETAKDETLPIAEPVSEPTSSQVISMDQSALDDWVTEIPSETEKSSMSTSLNRVSVKQITSVFFDLVF